MKYFDLSQSVVYIYIAMFLLAMGITIFSIPNIIFVAKKKRLLDKPDHRKKHVNVTPNLGGIGIFSAFIFVASIFNVGFYFTGWNCILGASFLLFVTGLKDDLVAIDPYKKFLAQLVAAIIVVYLAGIRLENLQGFLGIYELPYLVSFLLSVVGITFVTNAFNLIDGVDGLAGSLSMLLFTFLGVLFAINKNIGSAMLCFTIAGAVAGFLRYNIAPAKIFMGDTGSLILGFLASVMAISFVSKMSLLPASSPLSGLFAGGKGGIVIALAAIIVPVYDTFRVFTTRILRGFSPFHADRTHVHHVLLDIGLNATQVAGTLVGVTAFLIATAVGMVALGWNVSIAILVLVVCATLLLYLAVKVRNQKLEKIRLAGLAKENAKKEKLQKVSLDDYLSSTLTKPEENYHDDQHVYSKVH
ncbi:MraY family glycosyltransferase [Arachidicoccus terrestris]|uniref:MraY family glycosyltransferase n=1 Tax=Arachidicoccus terrestris TaxID=2875539 RepID=UPI001CC5B1BC|nr:MraY family glycosyltransferase [Arachidicoccus terrestris]UAY54260.1 undecaprenyl/decaprenyl-phosphate alpha-N-acetylglucosaminyl 1-phosphate transferase [Arachidicoccus terrestris]